MILNPFWKDLLKISKEFKVDLDLRTAFEKVKQVDCPPPPLKMKERVIMPKLNLKIIQIESFFVPFVAFKGQTEGL